MNTNNKYLVTLQDGRNEPIKDLDNATRVALIDKDTVGLSQKHLYIEAYSSGCRGSNLHPFR